MDEDFLKIYQSGEWNYDDYKRLVSTAKDDVKAIREEIYQEQTNDANLNLLNSTSATSIWEMFADIFAFVLYLLSGSWIHYEQRLKTAAATAIAHNMHWYALRATEFQLGDTLVSENGVVKYPVVDVSKRIIKAAAVKGGPGGSLILKVAKQNGNVLTALSSPELAAFKGYVNGFQDAGVDILVISQNPDVLKLILNIYYDPIVLTSTLQIAVEAAINNYVSNLPFDGTFRITKLVDALQSIEGIKDIEVVTCEASYNYTSNPNFTPIPVYYETLAGYMVIDPNYPLSGGINYIAHA